MSISGDVLPVIEKVEMVLEKFNGNPEDGDIAERLVIVDDVVVRHEVYENGEIVSLTEGGTDGTN